MLQAEQDIMVLAAQNGSSNAMDKLYRFHQKPLQRFAYKLCQDPDVAADAVQDTWIKTARNIRRLKDPRAFKSWLYRMLRWRIIDIQRQQVTVVFSEDALKQNDDLEQNIAMSKIDEIPNGIDDQYAELNAAIGSLPAIEKQIIHLFYLDEMKMNEIAIVIEIPIGTVKSRLNRARKLLREKFNDERSN